MCSLLSPISFNKRRISIISGLYFPFSEVTTNTAPVPTMKNLSIYWKSLIQKENDMDFILLHNESFVRDNESSEYLSFELLRANYTKSTKHEPMDIAVISHLNCSLLPNNTTEMHFCINGTGYVFVSRMLIDAIEAVDDITLSIFVRDYPPDRYPPRRLKMDLLLWNKSPCRRELSLYRKLEDLGCNGTYYNATMEDVRGKNDLENETKIVKLKNITGNFTKSLFKASMICIRRPEPLALNS